MTDVFSSNQFNWPSIKTNTAMSIKKVKSVPKPKPKPVKFVKPLPSINVVDEVMTPVLTTDSQARPTIEVPSTAHIAKVFSVRSSPLQQPPKILKGNESDHNVAEMVQSPKSPKFAVEKVGEPDKEMLRNDSLKKVAQSPRFKFGVQESETPKAPIFEPLPEISISQEIIIPEENNESFIIEDTIIEDQELENEEEMMRVQQEYEVAMAKLILISRKWKRNSLKQKELRKQRQLAANAALSSLTLGPPIQQIETSKASSRADELDIERAVRERRERQKKSWSRMNISEIIGSVLSSRNPNSKCLCWKLILSSEGDGKTNHMASLWLHSKLHGVQKDNDDELVISTQDFSLWSKWFNQQLCLSIIREAKFDTSEEDDISGVGGLLFLVSESLSLEAQKAQLQSLLMLLPSGSALPLLILCSSQSEEIINGLGLNDVDKTRVRSFLVLFIFDDLDGFYSSERLTEGLTWLANNSPIQPVVHCIKTRELVMDHLSISSLEMPNVAGPNKCISRFNKALDMSATEIISAARTNPTSWPCTEINNVLESFVPSVGWSSEERINPVLSRIESCKLPFFSYNMDWMNFGSDSGEEILRQKLEFENCFTIYLAENSKMMDETLARTEASVITQKGVLLELQGSKYYFKPNWTRIFRRIFNWRLMNLTSEVYVLKERNFEVENLNLSNHHQPSLDEMIQVCFNTAQFRRPQTEAVVCQEIDEQEMSEQVVEFSGKRKFVEDDDGLKEMVVVSNKVSKEADKLSKLLEQCNIVQNKIEEQLFIYF